MPFVADDLVAWLVGKLADAGGQHLITWVLGSDQERALRRAATAAVQRTAAELRPPGSESAEELAMVISQVFGEPLADVPQTGQTTLLGTLRAGIAGQLAVLDDAGLTGTGQSSADVLGLPTRVLADRLTAHLVQEIVLRGSRGGPLTPLADQLNHDKTHLQGQRVEDKVDRLAGEVRDALARPEQIRVSDPQSGVTTEGPNLLRLLLGTLLRRLRESRGITAQAAGRAIRGSESKISRIEFGRNAIRETDVLDLLTFYGAGPTEREQLLSLAEQSNRPGWWRRFDDIVPDWFQSYIGMEGAVTSICVYEPQLVPGLLQTHQYAGAFLAECDIPLGEAKRLVILREQRQRKFAEGGLKLWAIVEETALRRPLGSKKILQDQLRYLLSLTDSPNLTLQIIPDSISGHAVAGGFTILRFDETDLPDVAYLEHLTSALYLEKKSEVDKYLRAMERLRVVSAKPGETPGILTTIINRLEEELDKHPQQR